MRHKLRLGWADAKLTQPVERYVAVDNAFNAMLFGERPPAGLVLVEEYTTHHLTPAAGIDNLIVLAGLQMVPPPQKAGISWSSVALRYSAQGRNHLAFGCSEVLDSRWELPGLRLLCGTRITDPSLGLGTKSIATFF